VSARRGRSRSRTASAETIALPGGASVVLRSGGEADLDTIADLERRSFSHPWSREAFVAELRNARSSLLVAERRDDGGGALVGYLCRWIVEDEAQILNVTIHPEWRRRGLGRRMLEQALDEAASRGARRATLEVRRYNLPAIALYERMGFRRVGERRNYYGPGEDALLMEKDLDAG
jgi:[ribosomal protein S18]-alanine N-acetyltransferase